jgi:hypothetical protein
MDGRAKAVRLNGVLWIAVITECAQTGSVGATLDGGALAVRRRSAHECAQATAFAMLMESAVAIRAGAKLTVISNFARPETALDTVSVIMAPALVHQGTEVMAAR